MKSVFVSGSQAFEGPAMLVGAYRHEHDDPCSLWISFTGPDSGQRIALHLSAEVVDILLTQIADVRRKESEEYALQQAEHERRRQEELHPGGVEEDPV